MPKPSLREAFADAGMTELHTHGYNATGVAAIAARAGGPKGSFYNHFASKEELAADVLERYAAGRRIEMLTDPAVAPLDRIRAHFAHLRADLAEFDYARGCMFGNFAAEVAATNARLGGLVATSLEAWVTTLAATIEQARAAGDIRSSIDPRRAAQILVDAWEGAALRAKAAGGSAPLDNVVDFAFTDLLTKD
jgi:TetR/AcrR family transcriptional repressor of nem operon